MVQAEVKKDGMLMASPSDLKLVRIVHRIGKKITRPTTQATSVTVTLRSVDAARAIRLVQHDTRSPASFSPQGRRWREAPDKGCGVAPGPGSPQRAFEDVRHGASEWRDAHPSRCPSPLRGEGTRLRVLPWCYASRFLPTMRIRKIATMLARITAITPPA